MLIKLDTQKKKEYFNKTSTHPLQTWQWGEFRKVWGNKVIYTKYGLLTLHEIPFTNFKIGMFIKGPKPNQEMLDDLKNFGKKQNLIFIKLEPNFGWKLPISNNQLSTKSKLINLLKKNGGVDGKTLFTPTTFWIDLTKSEEDLLRSFHPKTRYNIRIAQKHGVEVLEDNSDKAFDKYIELTRETVERQGFYAHNEKYHRLMWEYLHKIPILKSKTPIARLLIAKYKGEIITAWIVFVWKDFLYYPYGASSSNPAYKPLMANNLMMWEAIRFGKSLGLKTFDLWGREEGKGFTKFKEGYKPQVVEFLGSWDIITSQLYWPYRAAELLRWQILRIKGKLIKPKF